MIILATFIAYTGRKGVSSQEKGSVLILQHSMLYLVYSVSLTGEIWLDLELRSC